MMRLHLLAPTIVDFSCAPGSALRNMDSYEQFWRDRADEAPDRLRSLVPEGSADGSRPSLTFDHQRSSSRSNRYRTIDQDSLERPLHVLTWSLSMDHVPVDVGTAASADLRDCVTEVSCRLHDHDVMLVELTAEIDGWFDGCEPADHGRRTDELQAAAVDLGAAVAKACHDHYVVPALSWLRTTDRDETVVAGASDPSTYPSGLEPGNVLWVARALIAHPVEGPESEPVLRHWVKDIPQADTDEEPPADMLVSGEIGHLTRWLNYAYVARRDEPDPLGPEGRCKDEWDALRTAQFFYAALDTVDSRLAMVLAEAFVTRSREELNRLKGELARLSGRAQLVLLQYRDITKYLKRSVRQEMEAILQYWSFTEVVEQPVMTKVEACQQRLSDLAAKQAARSALYTDLILLGIGVTSVLGTALALAEFGRTTASDPDLSAYDMAGGQMIQRFAAQPADTILVVSGAVSLVLIVIFLFARRNHET